MPDQTRDVSPGPAPGTVITQEGHVLTPPSNWSLLPPGDAALTRRVKKAGPSWTVQEKKGRKTFSRGVYASTETIETIRQQLTEERSTESYAKRRAADLRRREEKHAEYVDNFQQAVEDFLAFAPRHAELGKKLAVAVSAHATPVGSGTVARTQRIPIRRRAESAVIAWLRHQTTAYDNMKIPRVKGKRREVRRMLAEQSRQLLDRYRSGEEAPSGCPLQAAVSKLS